MQYSLLILTKRGRQMANHLDKDFLTRPQYTALLLKKR